MSNDDFSKLSICGFGLACGLTWGLSMILLAYVTMCCDIGIQMINLLKSLYVGFDSTWLGGVIGFGWGLLDGFIFGAVLAFFYNLAIRYCKCWGCK